VKFGTAVATYTLKEVNEALGMNGKTMEVQKRSVPSGQNDAIPTKFHDRPEAGRRLAGMLTAYSGQDDVLVIAIAKGGVPVAVEVAKVLSRPLDTLVVEEIGACLHEAWQQPQSIGAVTHGGIHVLNTDAIDALHLRHEDVEQAVGQAQREQAAKEAEYHEACPFPDIRGHTVILVDDGIGTGASMHAAIKALREHKAARVIAAAPLGSESACRRLSQLADEVICPFQQGDGTSIQSGYEAFPKVRDQDVRALIQASRRNRRVQ
jgi:predicted phosphoribosyltransferase